MIIRRTFGTVQIQLNDVDLQKLGCTDLEFFTRLIDESWRFSNLKKVETIYVDAHHYKTMESDYEVRVRGYNEGGIHTIRPVPEIDILWY